MRKLMTGNEAVAYGAYEAGVRYASAYPGTPSTEILENMALYKDDIKAEWAANEKVALESAIGASIAGGRALSSMKHVGLNVASDAFMTVAYTGINGGLVVITADEPGQHSSQNEQDNRHFASFGKVPMLEPSDSQETKDMIGIALEISEDYDTPVLFRMTTRICHSKSIVECGERQDHTIKEYNKEKSKYVVVPGYATKMRVKVEERMEKLKDFSNNTDLNFIEWNDKELDHSFRFWREEVIRLKEALEEKFDVEITEEKLRESIKERNHERKILMDFYELGKLNPSPISGYDINMTMETLGFQFNRKSMCESIEEKTKELKEKYENELKGTKSNRPRILITGCPLGGVREKVLKTIEDAGADIVVFENCGGVREKQDPVDETIDPIDAISRKYLNVSCSIMSKAKKF